MRCGPICNRIRNLRFKHLNGGAFVCVTNDKIRDDGNDAMKMIAHADDDTSEHFLRNFASKYCPENSFRGVRALIFC